MLLLTDGVPLLDNMPDLQRLYVGDTCHIANDLNRTQDEEFRCIYDI